MHEHVEAIVGRPAAEGTTLALVVVHRGEVVSEWYGTQPETPFGPATPVTADSTLISWSTAKSMTHAAVGLMVADGRLDPHGPAPVPEWQRTTSGRRSRCWTSWRCAPGSGSSRTTSTGACPT